MKNVKKFLALILALVSILSFAACSSGQVAGNNEEESSLVLEDAEDAGIEQKKVTIGNLTGKDAVELLLKAQGSDEWSLNILSQDYFHTNKAVEVTYTVKDTNVYDIRLVFEDGTHQDFCGYDFSAIKDYIYLYEESSSAVTDSAD